MSFTVSQPRAGIQVWRTDQNTKAPYDHVHLWHDRPVQRCAARSRPQLIPTRSRHPYPAMIPRAAMNQPHRRPTGENGIWHSVIRQPGRQIGRLPTQTLHCNRPGMQPQADSIRNGLGSNHRMRRLTEATTQFQRSGYCTKRMIGLGSLHAKDTKNQRIAAKRRSVPKST